MNKLQRTASIHPNFHSGFSFQLNRPFGKWLVVDLQPQIFNLLAALVLTLLFNQAFFQAVFADTNQQMVLRGTLILLLLLVNFLLMWLMSCLQIPKLGFLSLALIAALSHYFMANFGILIDKEMIQNAVETDTAEAAGLLSTALFLQLASQMLLPILFASIVKITPMPLGKSILHALIAALIWCLFAGSLITSTRAELIPFFRNFRDIKHLALPMAPISASISVGKQWFKAQFPTKLQPIATDAVLPVAAPGAKPRLLVVVLGETARADHFQLNGYAKATNPKLSQLPVVSFSQVNSCGTATAHSVPCMFSQLDQQHYDAEVAKNSENVLDVLQRVGVSVTWLDNNSGCKGVCNRVPSEMLFNDTTNPLCQQGQCHDAILLEAFAKEIAKPSTRDRIIVLHQLGSHGPEYFRRSQQQHKHFVPECTDKQIQFCQPNQLVNAYDNSLVATDDLLAQVIAMVQPQQEYQSAMLYVSDHGESLGENGTFLHGLPYWLAPEAQKHVPMIWWMSDEFAKYQQLSRECLEKSRHTELSHDYLFHSLIGAFGLQSQAYQANLDFLQSCRSSRS